nr:immunoglobulin light chain junction region [Macaca mulatta]MOX78258.1 immunoglobulin light chain junction region [Macaca mulatta]MOX82300.1 immunoglobulin light chain junction region [Macaca mulatta]
DYYCAIWHGSAHAFF